MVVLGVELLQLPISQICDLLRITTRVIDVWKNVVLKSDVKQIASIRHLPLHLIVHNTLEDQFLVFGLCLGPIGNDGLRVLWSNAPSLLCKIGFLQQGSESCIEIHGHEVFEVLGISSRKRVEGMVGGCEGVHEVGQSAREHFEERVPDRVSRGNGISYSGPGIATTKQTMLNLLLATAERSMLEDMRDARVIWRVGLEPNREDIIAVVAGDMQMLCTCLVVLQMQGCQLEFRDVLGSQ